MVYKLITSLHSTRYQLIHQQNSYASHGRWRTGRREAQSRELLKWVKILSVLFYIALLLMIGHEHPVLSFP
jgi:hypothetical protein